MRLSTFEAAEEEHDCITTGYLGWSCEHSSVRLQPRGPRGVEGRKRRSNSDIRYIVAHRLGRVRRSDKRPARCEPSFSVLALV